MINIYISSSCIKAHTIAQSVETLAKAGFKRIELSGGSVYYERILEDLLDLKARYSLHYLCHNYFPPPKQDFVVNLASLDSMNFERSLAHLLESLRFSHLLGAKHFGFHAGFFASISPKDLGNLSQTYTLQDKEQSMERFIRGFHALKARADELDIRLYIENNVINAANCARYGHWDLAMLLSFEQFCALKKRIDFSLLLDIGHLQVSARTMGLDFMQELAQCLEVADYVHISENNALSDENKPLSEQSAFLPLLQKSHQKHRIYTLEIYAPFKDIHSSYGILERALRAK